MPQPQPLQQPSRGIPTIGGDGEDASSPLPEPFFGGAVQKGFQSENVEMPMFSLLEGPQQSAPVAEPGAAPATGGTVFPTASVGGAARAPAPADETAASKAAPTTSSTVTSATPLRGAVGARESSAGAASSDAVAEAAPSTGDTTAPDASVERAARKLTLEESSAGAASSDVAAEAFPLAVRYHNSSWLKHGSSSSSQSSGNGSSSSSNDTTSNYGPWWDITCVGALLRLRDVRRGKAVLGVDIPFNRGKSWGRMQHGG